MAEENIKPPYVEFQTRAVEDRTASLDAGHFVSRDVHYAVITPAGSRDRIEKEAEAWLADIEISARDDRIPSTWPPLYRQKYEMWCKGQEAPEEGTPIRDWPAVSPAQCQTLLNIGIPTVEHLAEATEEALQRIGMGSRALREKARAWIATSGDRGQLSARLEKLETSLADSIARAESAEGKVKDLEKEIEALKRVKEKV